MTLSARNAPAVQLLAAPPKGNGDDRRQWRIEGGAVGAAHIKSKKAGIIIYNNYDFCFC